MSVHIRPRGREILRLKPNNLMLPITLPPQVRAVMKLANHGNAPLLPIEKSSLSFSSLCLPWLICGGITMLPFIYIFAMSLPQSSAHPTDVLTFIKEFGELISSSIGNILRISEFLGISIALSSAYIYSAFNFLKYGWLFKVMFGVNILVCLVFSYEMVQTFKSPEMLYYLNLFTFFGMIFLNLSGFYLIAKRYNHE